jgi:superfamily II DNA helicase RecQ
MVIASDVLDEIKTRFGHELRPFQREALEDGVLAKRDLFLIADTNAGKSIVFTCSPLVLRSPSLLRPICICVSPLNSLMRDQVAKLDGTGLSGVDVHEVTDKLRRGAYDLLYVSPEMLFSDEFMEMLLTPVYKDRLSLLYIDEVDCVSWQTFREMWGRLGEVRSFCLGIRLVVAGHDG